MKSFFVVRGSLDKTIIGGPGYETKDYEEVVLKRDVEALIYALKCPHCGRESHEEPRLSDHMRSCGICYRKLADSKMVGITTTDGNEGGNNALSTRNGDVTLRGALEKCIAWIRSKPGDTIQHSSELLAECDAALDRHPKVLVDEVMYAQPIKQEGELHVENTARLDTIWLPNTQVGDRVRVIVVKHD